MPIFLGNFPHDQNSSDSNESSSGSYELSSDSEVPGFSHTKVRNDQKDLIKDDEEDMDISSGEDDGTQTDSSLPG